MFTALAVALIGILTSGLGPGEMIAAFIFGAPLVMMVSAGMLLHLLPAVAPAAALLGGPLWAMGESRQWLRRRLPWACAGALFALAYGAARGGLLPGAESVIDFFFPDRRLQAAAIAIGGSGAGLAFRAAIGTVDIFFPPPEHCEKPDR